jgi:hypothetical protein
MTHFDALLLSRIDMLRQQGVGGEELEEALSGLLPAVDQVVEVLRALYVEGAGLAY